MRVAILDLGQRVRSGWQHLSPAAPERRDLAGYADPSPAGPTGLQATGHDAGRAVIDPQVLLRKLKQEGVQRVNRILK